MGQNRMARIGFAGRIARMGKKKLIFTHPLGVWGLPTILVILPARPILAILFLSLACKARTFAYPILRLSLARGGGVLPDS